VFYSAQAYYQPENIVTVQAGNTIETLDNVIIYYGSEYKFTAGQQIILNPGFHTQAGSNFTATIEPCDLIAKSMIDETIVDSLVGKKTDLFKLNTESLDLNVQASVFSYPNPSKNYTVIEYSLSKQDVISIEIYNMNGVLITTLAKNKYCEKGIYKIDFDTSNLTTGQYNCVLKTSSEVRTCKITKM